jgi:DNA-directed RNA polymerase specialized sigma24 family protein
MNENVINGSIRARDGTFWMQSHRQFAADGREHRPIDRLVDLVHRYDTLLPYTANPSIEVALRAIREARQHLDEIEYEAVAVARGARWSWRTIAEVLGLSTTAAHRRFARPRPETRPAPIWKWETDDDLEDLF